MKGQKGFELNTYRFVINALTIRNSKNYVIIHNAHQKIFTFVQLKNHVPLSELKFNRIISSNTVD